MASTAKASVGGGRKGRQAAAPQSKERPSDRYVPRDPKEQAWHFIQQIRAKLAPHNEQFPIHAVKDLMDKHAKRIGFAKISQEKFNRAMFDLNNEKKIRFYAQSHWYGTFTKGHGSNNVPKYNVKKVLRSLPGIRGHFGEKIKEVKGKGHTTSLDTYFMMEVRDS